MSAYMILEAKRPNTTDWGVRSLLPDINHKLRDRKITIEEALERTIAIRAGWLHVEPHTDFRVVVVRPD